MSRKSKRHERAKPEAQASAQAYAGNGGRINSPYPIASDSTSFRWRPQIDKDVLSLIPQYRQRAMLSDARYIYTSEGMVSGAVHTRADYVVGAAWMPAYLGSDARYKAAVTPLLQSWVKRCEMRGGQFVWNRIMWLLSRSLDVDGDAFVVLTEDESSWPRIQLLEAHRVGNPDDTGEIKSGPYAGMSIHGGVVYDKFMRAVAYNLLPPDVITKRPGKNEPNFIPASGVVHVWDPKWVSSTRGIPTLCHGIKHWYSASEATQAEETAIIANSKIALIEKNETGRRSLDRTPFDTNNLTAGQASPHIETMADGLIRFIKKDGDISAHSFARPGDEWEKFMTFILRGAFSGMGWPIEFGHDMSQLGAGAIRGVVGQVKRSVETRQSVLETPATSMVLHAIGTWMRTKQVPFTPDWFNIGFSYPPTCSVDVGRDSQNRREDLAIGSRTLTDVVTEDGGDIDTHLRTRARDFRRAQEIAIEEGVPVGAVFDPARTFGQPVSFGATIPSMGDDMPEMPGKKGEDE